MEEKKKAVGDSVSYLSWALRAPAFDRGKREEEGGYGADKVALAILAGDSHISILLVSYGGENNFGAAASFSLMMGPPEVDPRCRGKRRRRYL